MRGTSAKYLWSVDTLARRLFNDATSTREDTVEGIKGWESRHSRPETEQTRKHDQESVSCPGLELRTLGMQITKDNT
jgi:hypothetical protein